MEQAILEAAEALFLEKGFALTSTTEIAKAVGCNQALVHYYFRTKENLFDTIFEKKAEILFSSIPGREEKGGSWEDLIGRLVEAHFEMVRANPRLPFLVFNELLTNPARLGSLKARVGGMVAAQLARWDSMLKAKIAEGAIRPIGTFDLILTIVSLDVSFFLGAPIVKALLGIGDEEFEPMIEARKREIVETVIRSIRN
jgi:AcrR family transcriptional regulator